MEVRCSACAERNPARARFCLACGTPIGGPASDDGLARASRRTLTILIADVVGFTAMSERLDSESLRGVMDRFYAEMQAAIEGQGGTLAKFIGDAVVAVWGTPQVREDDALRAVRCADDMRGALRTLNEDLDRRWAVRLGLRTGVNTGEVVADPARGADLLVGDALNVAARLEQAAADGDVLLGPDTARLVRDEVDLEPIAPLRLKGKEQPLSAWRLRSARPGDRRRSPRLHAPLVGREREIAHLRSAFYGAAAARETRLVSVIGSPGVGKSRLIAEFTAGIGHEARVLRARCEPVAGSATLLPLAGLIRTTAGVDERDGAAQAQAKLAALLPDEPERELLAERAAGIAGLGPQVGVEESFWAVRRFLEALAGEQPVVLVIDDVHWASPTLLDLHEHLARWGREAPVLVVAVARPEIRELCPPLAVPGDVAMDVIELGPLGAQDSRTLVDRLLGAADLPPALAGRVLETTEGNPLFLGETLRMLVDEGVLRRDDGHWAVATAADVTVPPTIQALLAARIERLRHAERLVVERAAVIGQQFARGAVAELLGPGARDGLQECLESLRRKELVVREDGAPADGPVFRFHHALIRDAAYRSLLKQARAELHERHAAWLADRPGDHDEAIGFHLERAHAYHRELGRLDERGHELGRRAAEHLHAAGRRALAREDQRAAAELLMRGLAALDGDAPERGLALLPDLAEALLSAGDTARAEPVVEKLIQLAEGDARLEAWATVFACQLANLASAGHVRETIGRLHRASAMLAQLGDHAGEAKAHHVAADAHASLGEVAAAELALDRALVAARAAGDRRRVTAVLSGAPRAALWGPSPIVRASGRCLDVVRVLRLTPGTRHVEAAALRCAAVLEAMRGRAAAARDIIAAARATLEELGLTFELHELAVHAGMVELLAGDPEAAERELRAAKDGLAALGAEAGAAQAAALLARALLDQDRDAEAEAETRFAELRGGEDLKTAIAWHGARAEALARRGDHETALALARRAVELGAPTDALADKADALMALAAVLRAAGREEDARGAASSARDAYAAKDHAVGCARAEAAAGLAPAAAVAVPAVVELAAAGQDADGADGARADGDTLVERVQAATTACLNDARWEDLRALYVDEMTITGLGAVGQTARGADAVVAMLRDLRQDVPDAHWVDRVVAVHGEHLAVAMTELAGQAPGGGEVAAVVWQAVLADPDGRLRRVERFDTEDEALSRLRVLAAWTDGLDDGARRLSTRDWEAVGAGYWPQLPFVDHRAGLRDAGEGLQAWWQAVFAETSELRVRLSLLDARGGRFASARVRLDGTTVHGGRFELMAEQILSVDRDGIVVGIEMFDAGDPAIEARLDELERGAVATG